MIGCELRMFRGIIYIFVICCGYISGIKSNHLIRNNSYTEFQDNNHALERQMSHQIAHIITEVSEVKTKMKRGIVIVDEDFDVPPGSIRKNFKSTDVFDDTRQKTTLEGSGDETQDFESKTTSNMENGLKSELDNPDIIKTTPKSLPIENEFEKVKSSNMENGLKSEIDNPDIIKTTLKSLPIENELEKVNSKNAVSTLKSVYDEFESSGDGLAKYTTEFPTTETSTKTVIKPVVEAYEPIPDICLNFTCSSNDLFIRFSEKSNLIPEGTNLSLSCISNNSDHNMLYWYKSNGSIYFLQAFGKEQKLLLNVPDTKTFHSGLYKCVKWINKESCCNMESNITIYEVPQYTYHLIILALVTAACLLICIFLAIRQTVTIKTYTNQFKKKHGSVKQQLL